MAKNDKEKAKKQFTRFVSREEVAGLCSGNTFLDDALKRISERGKDLRIDGGKVFVTFGENTYEIRGAGGLAEMLSGIAYDGISTAHNIGIEETEKEHV